MHRVLLAHAMHSGLVAALALLGGCASPVFRNASPVDAAPIDVAARPESYLQDEVIWGGKILDVRNHEAASEVQIIAYPLDRAQRPLQSQATEGRFLLLMPGFVEPLDFPPGRFVTVRGRVNGVVSARIDEHDYAFPRLVNADVHVWPVNFPYERARVSFGIGLGVGIR